jgi:hypothetical protein
MTTGDDYSAISLSTDYDGWLQQGHWTGDAWVAGIPEVAVETFHCLREEHRRQMLIPRGHWKVVVPKQLGNGGNAGAFHA